MTSLGLSVESADPLGDTEDLYYWLREVGELRRQVRQHDDPPVPGQMGSISEITVAAVGAGGMLSVLASSLKGWLDRPRGSEVRVKARGRDKEETIEVTVIRGDVDTDGIVKILKTVLRQQED